MTAILANAAVFGVVMALPVLGGLAGALTVGTLAYRSLGFEQRVRALPLVAWCLLMPLRRLLVPLILVVLVSIAMANPMHPVKVWLMDVAMLAALVAEILTWALFPMAMAAFRRAGTS